MTDETRIFAELSPTDQDVCIFTAGCAFLPRARASFDSKEKAEGSPLVSDLFGIPCVAKIMVAENTVAVTKSGDDAWQDVAPEIGKMIRARMETGEPYVSENALDAVPPEDEIKARVQEVLDQEINPGIASHGGSISLAEVKGATVYLNMEGGCQGCSHAKSTMKYGVETALRTKIPELGAVLDATDHACGMEPHS